MLQRLRLFEDELSLSRRKGRRDLARGGRRSERASVAQRAGLAALRFLSPSSPLFPHVYPSQFLSPFFLACARQNKEREKTKENSEVLFLIYQGFFHSLPLSPRRRSASKRERRRSVTYFFLAVLSPHFRPLFELQGHRGCVSTSIDASAPLSAL